MVAASQRADGLTLMEVARAHEPFDAIEGSHRDRIIAWLQHASSPLDRESFEPGHAVGSAFVLSGDGRSVALVHHARLHRWLQPGGHAKRDECDLADIAAREANEELGIELAPRTLELFDVDVQTIPAWRSVPEHLHFDFRFLCSVPSQPLHAATDAMEARWFSAGEARQIATDPGLVRMLDKAISRGHLRA